MATTVHVLTRIPPAGFDGRRASALMDFITGGGLQVLFLDDEALVSAFDLMVQYADAPMDFADASLVVTAESSLPAKSLHNRPQ